MISDSSIGWAPPERVKRSVQLPEWLDREIEKAARENRSTPAVLIADALEQAVEKGWTGSQEPPVPGVPDSERSIALDPRISEELDKRIKQAEASGRTADFSELTALLALYYLRHQLNVVTEEPSGE